MPNKSIIGRFFDAIIDIIHGFREIVVALIFGKDALKVPIPTDKAEVFEKGKEDEKTTTLKKSKDAKVKQRNKNTDTKQKDGPIKSEGNIDKIDDAAYTSHNVSFDDANKICDTPIGSRSLPIASMDFESFKNAIENELMAEYMMNPSNGIIEIGGQYFNYFPDNERVVKGTTIHDVIVTDSLSGNRIFSLSVFRGISEDGELKNDYKINAFEISDMSMFLPKEAVASKEEMENGDETVVDIEKIELEANVPQKEEREIIVPQTNNYKEFLQTIQERFDAKNIAIKDGEVFCERSPVMMDPDNPDSALTSFKFAANGNLYGIDDKNEFVIKPETLGKDNIDELSAYIRQNIDAVTATADYKVYDALSKTEKEYGSVEDVHFKRNGDEFELTNIRNGQAIGTFENGSIRFAVDAQNIEEALMITDCVERMSMEDALKLAQNGDTDAFCVAIQNYSEEERDKLIEEIELMYYVVSRADRENFDDALVMLSEPNQER